ncbi:MAG TPA: hypothetical protein VKT76_18675 [Bradyrhizobium sp.]|nr:hypothetical protein [Bradyrhizobium sp.]
MALLAIGEYRPDVSDYEGKATRNILNVIPRGDGYGPFPSFSAYTALLPSACRGAFYALKFDGTVVTFAGTGNKLYKLNNTDFTWTDVSLGGGTYGALSATAQWQFAQTGNLVFATQANAVLQVFDLTSSTTFANALGSPPQAAYISVVGQFLVLSGLLSTPYRIQWSGLNSFNATTSWTIGVNSSDFQDFPDGGIVRGVAGGESGIIFQDQAIRRMSFVPGSPIIFQIDRITQDKGLFAPYSIIRAGERIFFYAGQGFHKIEPGGVPQPIGLERVDRTFLADLDKGNLQLFQGAADPRSSRVYWAYKSVAGTSGSYDKLLGYDFLLDRFFPIAMTGEYLLGISQTGLTLENLDTLAPGTIAITGTANNGAGLIRLAVTSTATLSTGQIISISGVVGTVEANAENWRITVIDGSHIDLAGSTFVNAYVSGGTIAGSLDAMTLSLDAYATAVQPEIGQFNSAHGLGFFRGANLEATIESAEQGTDENRITIRGFRPITDAVTLFGSASYRDTISQVATPGGEVAVSARTGRCDVRRDTRYSRFKVRIPAATPWSFFAGIVPDVVTGGTL